LFWTWSVWFKKRGTYPSEWRLAVAASGERSKSRRSDTNARLQILENRLMVTPLHPTTSFDLVNILTKA
jgi:hypothetical protein